MPTVTELEKGLMSSEFYNIGKRKEFSLGSNNTGKLITIISTPASTYRRICVKVEGFFEGQSFLFMIYSQTSNTTRFSTTINKITTLPEKMKIYSKVIDEKFNIFIRSIGSSGNPCYIQITHYGNEALKEIGHIYDYDDSFTEIS